MINISNHNIFRRTIYHKRFLPKNMILNITLYLLDMDIFDLKV